MDKSKKNKINNLNRGLERFFNKKFPPENFNINSYITDLGYFMDYLGIEYSMNFIYTSNGSVNFCMSTKLEKLNGELEEKIEKVKLSNSQLDKTKYLRRQRIYLNKEKEQVEINCRLKKIPESEKEINKFSDQLWGSIIKRIMIAVNPKLYSDFYKLKIERKKRK